VEIGGNHTDHQRGRVLAAAINLEMTAIARRNNRNTICISGEESPEGPFSSKTSETRTNHTKKFEIDLRSLDVLEQERGTSAALVRGVAAWFSGNGHPIGGFDAQVSSDIPIGAGLSSSAAFEVMIGNVFKGLYGADVSQLDIAIAGQFSENVYFGKPCGLMDQMASAFGGLNMIDFQDPRKPVVTPVNADFPGFSICVVNTGGSHADLTQDFFACTNEMKAVAECFGKEYLREVPEDEFFASIGKLRRLGDRTVLRAIHFFGENERASRQAQALVRGDMKLFLQLVIESGRSSLAYLQNVFSPAYPREQGLTLALALSEKILAGKGAWRVHGGGFAGSILAFVPEVLIAEYGDTMSGIFGEGCCHFLNIRKEGGMEINRKE